MKTLILSGAIATAALLAALPGAYAQGSGNGKFCLQKSGSGAQDCKYQTMAQCEAAKKGVSATGTCSPNKMTTGQGGSMQKGGSMNSNGMAPKSR